MLPDIFISIMRIILVVLILFGMIMVLLGINHLSHNDDVLTSDETEKLKNELMEEKRVITSKSVFHNFLVRTMKRGR